MKWTADKKGRVEIDREDGTDPIEFENSDEVGTFIDELSDAYDEIVIAERLREQE